MSFYLVQDKWENCVEIYSKAGFKAIEKQIELTEVRNDIDNPLINYGMQITISKLIIAKQSIPALVIIGLMIFGIYYIYSQPKIVEKIEKIVDTKGIIKETVYKYK